MELIKLIKMLFTPIKDVNELNLIGMKHFPFKGYKYMMWCGNIIYRGNETPIISEESLTHETIHLMQAKVKGSWIKYYWSYFIQWMKGNPIIHPASSAYYTIPYEMEAYANQHNKEYIDNYHGQFLHCYVIKDRKKTYKLKGGTPRTWKVYLKTIKLGL